MASNNINLTNIPTPSIKEVKYWLNNWNTSSKYVEQENAVSTIFTNYNSNSSLTNILIKTSILNDFYSTNIYDTYSMANHIFNLNITSKIMNGCLCLVNDIAQFQTQNTQKYRLSFASKYCSHHKPDIYPIYDSNVVKMLKYFRNKDRFYNFKNNDLKNYVIFKNIYDNFIKFYNLQQFSYKEIDRYLWQAGKRYF